MGVGHITEAREVTRGTVSDGGSSVRVGGGEVPKLTNGVEDALGERLKKVESLGIVGNAWMARRERAVDEAERLIRDHELESRTVGYTDEHGVRRPGIETLRGEQAAGAADAWQRHNLKFAEKVRSQEGIELDQRQWDELRRRLHNDMTRTYANLSKWSATQVAGAEMVKVGADYTDSLKRRNGELMSVGRNDAVVGAEKALGADDAGIAKMREDLEADDVEHYVSSVLQDRDDFVVRSVQRGYGLKSAAAAKAEADKVMRESAEAAVLSLAQAGRYDRARKLVEQGRRLGYDDAAIAKGRELVDKFEKKAQADAFNGVQNVAQSAVASGMLASVKDPQTGALLPGMEDAIGDIRDAKAAYAPGTELRAAYDRLEAQVTGEAEKAQASQYLAELANVGRTDVEPTDEIKAEPWKLRAFEAAKDKYLKAVEQQGNDLRAARDLIWKENADRLKRLEAAYFQARAREGGWNSKATDQAYANLKRTWNEIGLGGVSGEYAKTFLGDLKDIDNEEIVEGMTEFWRMLKGVKVIGPKDSRSREASSGGPELDKYGALTDATVRHMDLGEEVGFDTGDESQPFTMTVDEALVFSEQVRYELRRMDVKDRRKSEAVRDVVKKVYVNAAKAMADGKIRDGEKGQELAREFGEQMTNLKMKLEEPSLKAALDEGERQDDVQKPYGRKK